MLTLWLYSKGFTHPTRNWPKTQKWRWVENFKSNLIHKKNKLSKITITSGRFGLLLHISHPDCLHWCYLTRSQGAGPPHAWRWQGLDLKTFEIISERSPTIEVFFSSIDWFSHIGNQGYFACRLCFGDLRIWKLKPQSPRTQEHVAFRLCFFYFF